MKETHAACLNPCDSLWRLRMALRARGRVALAHPVHTDAHSLHAQHRGTANTERRHPTDRRLSGANLPPHHHPAPSHTHLGAAAEREVRELGVCGREGTSAPQPQLHTQQCVLHLRLQR